MGDDDMKSDPTREQLDAWLTEHCGTGLPHGEATDRDAALHGLAYILRQIEGTYSYKVHIGQCNSATSSLRWALDFIAAAAFRAAPPAMDREAVGTVAFVQEWMMSGDHEPDQWHRDFAAAIDARTASPDTMVLLRALLAEYAGQPNQAGEAYKLVDATLSADAIRQGEVLSEILSRFPAKWKVRQVQFSAPCADDRKWHVNVYGGREGRDAFVGRGATAELALLDAATQADPMPATPASHASDGGEA